MRSFGIGIAVLMLACGCSQDDGASVDEQAPDAAAGGGTATARDAAAGGKSASGGSVGTGGTHGVGGASGTGGASSRTGGASGTGGASSGTGGGGTGGADGGPPRVVMPCGGGAGELPRGVWTNVTPPQVDLGSSGTLAFAIDRSDSRNIYLGTMKRGIFRTSNCGATWTRIDTGQNAGIDKGNNNHLILDPSNPKVLYTTAGYGGPSGVFKSTNGGADWQQSLSSVVTNAFYAGGFIESVSMDPTNPAHLVTSPHGPCSGTSTPGCVAETTDSGATWKVLANGAPEWVETANLEVMDGSTWLVGQIFGKTWRTGNAGASWQQVGSADAAAYYRAASGTIYSAGIEGVQKSADAGLTWQLVPNSPKSSVITGDGTRIYVDWAEGYWSAPESDTSKWTDLKSPAGAGGACLPSFTYDRDHEILYTTNCSSGFWRVTTP